MLDHLRCCHKEEYFQSTTSDSSDSEKQDGNADPKSKRTKEPNKKQLTIRTLLKRKNPTPIRKITQKKQKADKQLVQMVVNQYFPLRFVDQEDFLLYSSILDPCYVIHLEKSYFSMNIHQ